LIEWDQKIPPIDELIDELEVARAHANAALASIAEPAARPAVAAG
jgi:hypothetical protein